MLNREALAYVPGALRCAKCNFRLVKTKLNVADGNTYANNEPDTCPNCDVPMWRVSWQEEAKENFEIAESQMKRAKAAEDRLAALAHIRTSMAMLQQNSEGCALNHYGDDAHQHGLPGWLVDTRKHLDELTAMLAAAGGEG